MKFVAVVEPPEPMRGLEVPERVVEALGGGTRPPVTVTINGHSWQTRIAIMRGRHLIGLSHAHRRAAGVEIGDEVEVRVTLDSKPRTLVVPDDFVRALDGEPRARAAYDQLSPSRRRAIHLSIEGAKRPETRARRVEQAVADLVAGTPPRRGGTGPKTR